MVLTADPVPGEAAPGGVLVPVGAAVPAPEDGAESGGPGSVGAKYVSPYSPC